MIRLSPGFNIARVTGGFALHAEGLPWREAGNIQRSAATMSQYGGMKRLPARPGPARHARDARSWKEWHKLPESYRDLPGRWRRTFLPRTLSRPVLPPWYTFSWGSRGPASDRGYRGDRGPAGKTMQMEKIRTRGLRLPVGMRRRESPLPGPKDSP